MVVCIDLGVSFIKIALYKNNELFQIKRVVSPTSFTSKQKHIHEVDADLFYNIVKELLDEYILKFNNINSILFSTQMHGFVLYSEGRAQSPYYSWKHEVDRLVNPNLLFELKNFLGADIVLKTGMPLRSGLPSVNLHVLGLEKKILPNYSFGTIADYIVAKLTNTKISTSISNAAGSGLFDLINFDWNYNLIDKLSLNLELPKVFYSYTDEFVGKYRKIPIFPPIGDQQASILGIVEKLNDIAVSNISTGSQASIVTKKIQLSEQFQTRPLIDDLYLLTIPFLPAGRSLNILIDLFKDIGKYIFNTENQDVWSNLLKFINKHQDDTDMKSNIDYFSSFSLQGGSLSNMYEHNMHLDDLMNSIICNLAENHISALKILYEETKFKKIILSGGVGRKIFKIKEIFEKNFNLPVKYAQNEEDALSGLGVISRRISF